MGKQVGVLQFGAAVLEVPSLGHRLDLVECCWEEQSEPDFQPVAGRHTPDVRGWNVAYFIEATAAEPVPPGLVPLLEAGDWCVCHGEWRGAAPSIEERPRLLEDGDRPLPQAALPMRLLEDGVTLRAEWEGYRPNPRFQADMPQAAADLLRRAFDG